MKDKVKFLLVIALVVTFCLSLGIYVAKPGTSIGMSTGYDKAATLTTLKTINSAVNEKTIYTDALTALVKQCLMLPDPIYSDLMWELKKTATETVKVKDFKTMVGNYILVLEGKTIPKPTPPKTDPPPTPPSSSKKYVFEGTSKKNTNTFVITKQSFKIKSLPTSSEKDISIIIEVRKPGADSFEEIFGLSNNEETSCYKGPGTYYLSLEPSFFVKSWKIEVNDGE
jgi:hypothetical protein